MRARWQRSVLVVLLLSSAAAVGACRTEQHGATQADSEGLYLDVGELKYQVQVSRPLNPSDPEDRGYLTGIPPAAQGLAGDETWFGVFLLVQNETDHPHPAATEFEIEDTSGNLFAPLEVTGSNVFAYRPRIVPPEGQIPEPESAAASGPIQGAMLLFKLKAATLDNRPLELTIRSPQDPQRHGTVELDV